MSTFGAPTRSGRAVDPRVVDDFADLIYRNLGGHILQDENWSMDTYARVICWNVTQCYISVETVEHTLVIEVSPYAVPEQERPRHHQIGDALYYRSSNRVPALSPYDLFDGLLVFIRRVVLEMFEAKKDVWLDFGPSRSVGWEVTLRKIEDTSEFDDMD